MGDLTPAQIASYAALGYTTIGGQPITSSTFGGAGYAPGNPAQPYTENFTQIPFGSSTEQVLTLDSFLSQWVAGVCAMPASLAGEDAMQAAAAIATNRCATISTPDCAQSSSLAAKYGAAAQACLRPASAPASAGVTNPTAPGTSSVAIQNTTRPGNSSFVVGDSWKILIQGAPNSQVTGLSYQNGRAVGSATPMGTTNGSGQLVLSGTFTPGTEGSWSQSWTVGGQSVGSISFTVSSVSASTGGTTPQGSNQYATSSNGPNQTFVGGGAGQSNAPNPTFVMPDFSAIPSWVWWAGAGVLGLLVIPPLLRGR